MLQTAANLGNESNWAQLFGMLDFLGIALPGTLQSVIRVCAAVLTLAWYGAACKSNANHGQRFG